MREYLAKPFPLYAGIMLNAFNKPFNQPLCSKLCWHNRPGPISVNLPILCLCSSIIGYTVSTVNAIMLDPKV